MNAADTPPDQRDSPDRAAQIERLVHSALQDLPATRAPHSLQARVLATLAHRETAWWHRPFATWPLPARVMFALCCATIAKLSVDGSLWLLRTPRLWHVDSTLFATWHALTAVQSSVLASIPALWWYSVLAAIAVACGGVFAIGTIAYQTLYAQRAYGKRHS